MIKYIIPLVFLLTLLMSPLQGQNIVLDIQKKMVIANRSDYRMRLALVGKNNTEINLKNYYNVQYIGSLYIGANRQKISVLYDTGSNVAWLNGISATNSSAPLYFQELFNCSLSITCIAYKNQKQDIQYGSGFVSGYVISDNIFLGSSLQLHQFKLLSIKECRDMEGFMGSGIVGLGYSPNLKSTEFSIIDQLYQQKQISKRQYSFYLNTVTGSSDSKLIIGEPNPTYYQGTLNYFKVIQSSYYWEIPVDQVLFNGKEIFSDAKSALIDSGTSLIILTSQLYTQFIYALKGKNKYCQLYYGQIFCQCGNINSNVNDYPILQFNIIDVNQKVQRFEFSFHDYMSKSSQVAGYCDLLVDQMDTFDGMIILGDVFMQKYFTTYDLDSRTIGLAGSIYLEPRTSTAKIIMWILIAILIIGIVVFIVYKYYINKNEEERQQVNDNYQQLQEGGQNYYQNQHNRDDNQQL